MRHILGISAFYHDSAAALLRDGDIVAAAQEERFSRKKNDERFPSQAISFCLKHAGLNAAQLDAVVFYDKPITKFTRMLESYLAVAPFGIGTFPRVIPTWFGEKLNLRKTIRDELPGLTKDCAILFTEHHHAHAASAFYPSPFEEAAILTVDGVGEWATTTIGRGHGDSIEMLKELRFPHSLGLLYSAFTAYCGFRINSGEYKLMGLAPYGEPKFVREIYDHLIDVKSDGSFWLNLDYFDFLRSFRMANGKFHALFGGPPREPEAPVEQRHMDVARSIQVVTEEIMLKLARHARELTGLPNLCMAGGVALNCVANGLILRERIFERLWIQPAAGDAGGALGAALAVAAGVRERVSTNESKSGASSPALRAPSPPFHGGEGRGEEARPRNSKRALDRERDFDAMHGSLLGPEFSSGEIEAVLKSHGAVYQRLDDQRLDDATLLKRTVELLQQEKVIGWVQGRMEFGPRALGNRSILGDPRSAKMQSVMNLKVKFRESFRPFAPIVLRDRVSDYFEMDCDSPYMLLVAPVRESLRKPVTGGASGLDRLKQLRSTIPAVTHVDYSARIQTVDDARNPRLHALLKLWEQATGCAVLVNTSFNVRGEPIVCTPDDAYRCFVNTEMDYLVIGNFLLDRAAQPKQSVKPTFERVLD